MNEELVKYIIAKIFEDAKIAKNDKYNSNNSDFLDGKLNAYYEILETIQTQLDINDISLSEYGIDINLLNDFI